MNMNHHIDNKLQFDFLLNTLRTRKRYTALFEMKKEKYLEYVKEYYGYSNEKENQFNILNDEQNKTIMNSLDKVINMENNIVWKQGNRCLRFC